MGYGCSEEGIQSALAGTFDSIVTDVVVQYSCAARYVFLFSCLLCPHLLYSYIKRSH